ncbi:MAG: TonB-dependent receptor [Longimonas sp.]|uniref:TonB-dependent receptor domain-containing protein n=1 Tax=Longimonas sp. TaxID=2039626 RepID=UPI00335A9202
MHKFLSQFITGVLVLFMAPGLVVAQSGTVTGTVTDAETGEPLPGANVVVIGTEIGVPTDVDGTFRLQNVPAGDQVIRATFVGYFQNEQDVTIEEGAVTEIDFQMEPDLADLGEVVVTGLGIQRDRGQAQVSVGRIDADDLSDRASFQDVSQLIGGNVAGVNVQAASGNIGGGIRFNVRGGGGLGGDGQPAIYIDGVRIDNSEIAGFGGGGQGISTLADLNPNDIESIDVVRGPAGAAIYGTEGANGVVLITTKSGSFSAEPTFDLQYRGTFGFNEQGDQTFDPDVFDDGDINRGELANDLFRRGAIQQHQVSISGGTESVRYYASVDNRQEDGALPNNSGDRTNLRANFEAFPIDELSVRASAGYTANVLNRPENDNSIQGSIGETLLGPTPYFLTDSLAIFNIEDVQRVNRFVGSVRAEYTPIENLTFTGSAGYDASTRRQDRTRPVGFSYPGIGTTGERNFFNRNNEQLNADLQAQYSYEPVSGVAATSLIGGQFTQQTLRTSFGTAQEFATDVITNIGAGDDFTTLNEDFLNERTGGIFAQQELVFGDTYFLTGQLRRDVATALGEGVTDVWYPSASAAVRLDRFDAIPEVFTLLRPRVAYGATGNLPGIVDGEALRYNARASGFGAGATIGSVGNPQLVPERVQEVEAGVDADLLDQYSIEATYYYSFANNSIIDQPLAPSTGFGAGTLPSNVGGIETQGVELGVGLTPLLRENARLDLNLTYAYQTSEVTDTGEVENIFDGFDVNVIREGLPRSAFFIQEVIGAQFDDQGVYIGPEATAERQVLGQPIPEHTGGLRFNLTLFQDLSVSGLAEVALGHQVYNNTLRFAAFDGTNAERNRLVGDLGELTPGTDEYRATAEALARTNPNFQGNFIEDADYLKMRELSVNYDFSSLIQEANVAGVSTLRLGVSARNLFTVTGYSGADPEVNFAGSRSLSRGQDFLTLPTPRQFTINVTVGF